MADDNKPYTPQPLTELQMAANKLIKLTEAHKKLLDTAKESGVTAQMIGVYKIPKRDGTTEYIPIYDYRSNGGPQGDNLVARLRISVQLQRSEAYSSFGPHDERGFHLVSHIQEKERGIWKPTAAAETGDTTAQEQQFFNECRNLDGQGNGVTFNDYTRDRLKDPKYRAETERQDPDALQIAAAQYWQGNLENPLMNGGTQHTWPPTPSSSRVRIV